MCQLWPTSSWATSSLELLVNSTVVKSLCKLDVKHTLGVTGKLLRLLGQGFPSLHRLVLSNCELNSLDLRSLAQTEVDGKLPQLKHLDLYHNKQLFGKIDDLFQSGCKWQGLLSLNVEGCSSISFALSEQNGSVWLPRFTGRTHILYWCGYLQAVLWFFSMAIPSYSTYLFPGLLCIRTGASSNIFGGKEPFSCCTNRAHERWRTACSFRFTLPEWESHCQRLRTHMQWQRFYEHLIVHLIFVKLTFTSYTHTLPASANYRTPRFTSNKCANSLPN